MNFGWINWINIAVIACLILVNVIAVKKGLSENFRSRYMLVNILEQIGRYGSMAFMVFPIFARNQKFGFSSLAEMFIWLFTTVLLLLIYVVLWLRKSNGGVGVFYGLAVVPVVLFLLNGILLRNPALIAASLIFGIFHLKIVKENE